MNSSLQVKFYNIYFRQIILIIECEKITEYLDDIEYEFVSNFQNIMIMQVPKTFSCEMVISERIIAST